MDKFLYVVFLDGTPIGVHKWPWMALNEVKERSIEGKPATMAAYKLAYNMTTDFEDEAPTEPDCVPCSHGLSCDDAWKPGPV